MRCPKCGKEFPRLLALSREDNKTMICDDCGMREAIAAIPEIQEHTFIINSSEKEFLNSFPALEEHYLKAYRQMEHDRKVLEIMRKGLDVPFSHIQAKNHQDTDENHPYQ